MKPVRYPLVKAITFCIVFVIIFIMLSVIKNFFPSDFYRFAHGITGILAGFITLIFFLPPDKLNLPSVGLRFEKNTIPRFFLGILAGIIIMGSMAGGVILFTEAQLKVNPAGNLPGFLLSTAPLILLAFMEELGFRSYPLKVIEQRHGIRAAIYVTSILFALYHIVNGWTIASSFYGPGVWGLTFGLAAVWSKGIALPTGLHYAANLTTAALGDDENKYSLWIVENNAVGVGATGWPVIIPSGALFLFGVVIIEIYIRKVESEPVSRIDAKYNSGTA